MRVYLVRHAEAELGSPDQLRPLTAQGRQDALSLAKRLSSHHLKINAIHHSKLLRAKQTAEVMAETLAVNCLIESDGLAPNDKVIFWFKQLNQSADDMMLVGHMPFMSLLVEHLTDHQDTVIFNSPQMVCLERSESEEWQLMWKEGA